MIKGKKKIIKINAIIILFFLRHTLKIKFSVPGFFFHLPGQNIFRDKFPSHVELGVVDSNLPPPTISASGCICWQSSNELLL